MSVQLFQRVNSHYRVGKLLRFLTISLVCFSAIALFPRLPLAAQNSVTQGRVVDVLEGNQVFIQGRPATVNDVANLGQQISTGQSRAEVEFNNSAITRLGRNSALTIGQCGAQLQQGSVLVNGAVSACTSRITAAVRGTTYVLEINDQGEEEIKVLEGEVEVTSSDDNKVEIYKLQGGQRLRTRSQRLRPEIGSISQLEYERVLSGPLVRGYRQNLRSINTIERTWGRLYPNRPFPLRNRILRPHRGHFSLAIAQQNPTLSQVVARISLRSVRGERFLEERFAGDYLYNINQKARFIRGLNPLDRVVVRLFDLQNRVLGYSEFELLDDNAAVTLVLPDRPEAYGTVRTILGIDADQNGGIDANAKIYDYFTRLVNNTYPESNELSAVFLNNASNIDLNWYRVANLPYSSNVSVYPDSFINGNFTLGDRPISIFSRSLPTILTAPPNQVTPTIIVNPSGNSTYEVISQINSYSSK